MDNKSINDNHSANFSYDICTESSNDVRAIYRVVQSAFASALQSDGNEQDIVKELRENGDLTVSLLAKLKAVDGNEVSDNKVIGHVAFSSVLIVNDDEMIRGYFGLAPVSVLPEYQGSGVANALNKHGLKAVEAFGAKGCVALDEPKYYQRFGFECEPDISYPGVPAEHSDYFRVIHFVVPVGDENAVKGAVQYAPAFSPAFSPA
ncbi:MAG: N-acetyltransferase [Thalassotalea sp.]|nr:N-acetyltransferase [Thalassotalea sp.]